MRCPCLPPPRRVSHGECNPRPAGPLRPAEETDVSAAACQTDAASPAAVAKWIEQVDKAATDPAQAEANAILAAIDTTGDSTISATELRDHLLRRGTSEADASALFVALNTSAGGAIGPATLQTALDRMRSGDNSLQALRAAMEPPTSVAFADLASAPDGCHRIPDTARRGITPAQLRAIVAHVARRLGFAFTEPADDDGIGKWERSGRGERWLGARAVDGKFLYAALGLHDVNLYDCCR